MGDGPDPKPGQAESGDNKLRSHAAALLTRPQEVASRPEANATAPAAPDKPKTPAEQINQQIVDHQQAALTAAKAHDPTTADKELKAAIALADSSQRAADRLLAAYNRDPAKGGQRAAYAKEFGLDPNHMTDKDIEAKLHGRGLTTEQKAHLEQLRDLQREYHAIDQLKETPAVTRAQTSFLKASGALEAPPTASPQEKLRVSQQNSVEAMQLLRDAERLDVKKELVGTPVFEQISATVNKNYQQYQESLAGQTVAALGNAENLAKDPEAQRDPLKKAQLETQYEAAYAAASRLDLSYIAGHQDVFGPHDGKPGILPIAEAYNYRDAALSYKSKMLIDQGKFADALPLLTTLQADVPALSTNPEFLASLRKAYSGNIDADIIKHQQAFHDIYMRPDDHKLTEDEKHKKYGAALYELNAAEDGYNKRSTQLTSGLQALQRQQQGLEQEQRGLGARGLNDQERQFEQDRINRELQAVKQQEQFVSKEITGDKTSIADISYWQGSSLYQMGELYDAHQKFQYCQDNQSSFATNPAFKLDDLLHATNFWSRNNWLKQGAFIVAGVAAGLIVGALATPETGPGGPIAGYLVGQGIIEAGAATTVAIGVNSTLMGAAAGSVTNVGMTAAFGDPITAGTFIRGAGLGAGGAAFNAVRLAFTPAVLAGTVPRVVAGMTAGTTYGVINGGADFAADKLDGLPTGTALRNYGLNVTFSAFGGAFTPASAFAGPSEVALENAWMGRVVDAIRGSNRALLAPTIEGTIIQSGTSALVSLNHHTFVPREDHSQERHDFSRDTDIIDETDPTTAPPSRHP